jgi:hypothetical protein
MRPALFQRRTIWCPTFFGWICLFGLVMAPCLFWWFRGESILSLTARQPTAEILVVEGWIGIEGMRAAAAEFKASGAIGIVTTGGLNDEHWSEKRSSYAEMARYELIRAGVPEDRVVAATAAAVETQRTFQMAVAAWRSLQTRQPPPASINVFTAGPHARRTRLVFAKVFQPGIKVGVVSWTRSAYQGEPWWRSSERANDLMKETVAYAYEALLNCGRGSNSPLPKSVP